MKVLSLTVGVSLASGAGKTPAVKQTTGKKESDSFGIPLMMLSFFILIYEEGES